MGGVSWFARTDWPLPVRNRTARYWLPMTGLGPGCVKTHKQNLHR
jgi:hypothetical protein